MPSAGRRGGASTAIAGATMPCAIVRSEFVDGHADTIDGFDGGGTACGGLGSDRIVVNDGAGLPWSDDAM